MNSDEKSAPVNPIALMHDEKARTNPTNVNINVYDLSLLKFRHWVSAVDRMSNADVDIMFYEDAEKNLVATQSEDIFHMALIQMMYEKSRENDVNKVFKFIVMRKGKAMSFIMVTSGWFDIVIVAGNPDGCRFPIRSKSTSIQPTHQPQRGVKRRLEDGDSPNHRRQKRQSKGHARTNKRYSIVHEGAVGSGKHTAIDNWMLPLRAIDANNSLHWAIDGGIIMFDDHNQTESDTDTTFQAVPHWARGR